jgi:hypothetical protein
LSQVLAYPHTFAHKKRKPFTVKLSSLECLANAQQALELVAARPENSDQRGNAKLPILALFLTGIARLKKKKKKKKKNEARCCKNSRGRVLSRGTSDTERRNWRRPASPNEKHVRGRERLARSIVNKEREQYKRHVRKSTIVLIEGASFGKRFEA